MKIFGIGLNKTGTTTLGQCGSILNYRCKSCDRMLLEDVILRNDLTRVCEEVNRYDLFEDWPWPLIYKDLDRMFPGSKFILTVRKHRKIWLDSLKKHSLRTDPTGHCRKLAYGYNFPHQREKEHLEIYNLHNEEVCKYFSGRKNDFIEICWENGDGFDKLCKFLGKPHPNVPVPHANRGNEVKVKEDWFQINMKLSLSGE